MTQFYLDLKEVEALAKRGGDPLALEEQEPFPSDCEDNSLRKRISEALNELQDYQTELGTKLLASPEVKNESETAHLSTSMLLDDTMEELWEPEPNFDMEEESKSDLQSIPPGSIAFEDVDVDDDGGDGDFDLKEVDEASESDQDYKSEAEDNPADDASSMSSDTERDWDGDSDSEAPPPKKVKSSRNQIKSKSNFDKISSLRELFIFKAESSQSTPGSRVRKRKGSGGGRKRCTDISNKISVLKHNPTTGKLTIGDIELIIREESKAVQCGSCSFQVTWSTAESSFKGSFSKAKVLSKLTTVISDHINGLHLGTFNCSLCPMKKTTRQLYVMHMNRCHSGRFPCDICGKIISTNQSLIVHRWTHMNEEEKKEAIRNGVKDPTLKGHQGDTEFPCSICGKSFKNKYLLKAHEDTHSGPGSRKLVICPICGKEMSTQSYNRYHKIYKCPLAGGNEGVPGGQPESRVKCPRCPKTLLNMPTLRYHIRASHGERSHLCSICGKAYSTKWDLQKHIKRSHGDKLWTCRWDCGKGFSWEKSWRKHEARCKNRNTNSKGVNTGPEEMEGLDENGDKSTKGTNPSTDV